MKRKEKFYIDIKKRKICKGKEYNWNTLIVNTEKLKWNTDYRNKIISRFKEIIIKRAEIKPIRINYTGPRKRYFSRNINDLEPRGYISRDEIKIIKRNEQTIKIINEIKGL